MSESGEGSGVPVSGTVAFIGRPNAGKSTLMNSILGEKVAIVSNKPQTTRHRLIGILTEDRGQMVVLDTPGVHKPLHRLNRRMMKFSTDALNEADVVCLVVDASARFGRGDQYMLEMIEKVEVPMIVALNKIDRMKKSRLLPEIERYHKTGKFEEIVPISALENDGLDLLIQLIFDRLPQGPPRFDEELLTLHTERFLVSERIREKVLERTRDELPFATAVSVETWEEKPPRKNGQPGAVVIGATLLVERSSQRKILIGKGGEKIKDIGMAARLDLEAFLERPVFLDLQVRDHPGWREDKATLNERTRPAQRGLAPPFDGGYSTTSKTLISGLPAMKSPNFGAASFMWSVTRCAAMASSFS